MALRIDFSTPKTNLILGSAASVLAICAVLFIRARGKTATAPTASALEKGRLSFLANIPILGPAYTYFNPQKPLPTPQVVTLGAPEQQLTTEAALKDAVVSIQKTFPKNGILVIHGGGFTIKADPGLLDLLPSKIILMGLQLSETTESDTLFSQLRVKNWQINTTFESLDQAMKAPIALNKDTGHPYQAVYVVKAS